VGGRQGAPRESVPDWEFEADEFIDAGDRVAVVGHFRGRGKESGAELSVQVALVSLVSERAVVRVEEYLDRDEALAAAGVK
jgi:ketosteroid isomerase-like protein